MWGWTRNSQTRRTPLDPDLDFYRLTDVSGPVRDWHTLHVSPPRPQALFILWMNSLTGVNMQLWHTHESCRTVKTDKCTSRGSSCDGSPGTGTSASCSVWTLTASWLNTSQWSCSVSPQLPPPPMVGSTSIQATLMEQILLLTLWMREQEHGNANVTWEPWNRKLSERQLLLGVEIVNWSFCLLWAEKQLSNKAGRCL